MLRGDYMRNIGGGRRRATPASAYRSLRPQSRPAARGGGVTLGGNKLQAPDPVPLEEVSISGPPGSQGNKVEGTTGTAPGGLPGPGAPPPGAVDFDNLPQDLRDPDQVRQETAQDLYNDYLSLYRPLQQVQFDSLIGPQGELNRQQLLQTTDGTVSDAFGRARGAQVERNRQFGTQTPIDDRRLALERQGARAQASNDTKRFYEDFTRQFI